MPPWHRCPVDRPEGWRPVPGPVDREGFDRAQRRHRRASWRWTVACAAAVALIGIPLSAAISPLLLAVAAIANDLVNLAVHTPDLLGPVRDALGDQQAADVPRLVATLAVALIVPGAAAITACWLAVRRIFRHAGAAADLQAMRARPARPDDLEERQLANVVAEIALAGGLAPPAVSVIDAPEANAAVAGTSPHDAVIVVSRGLLDHLDRDETQGVIAHLVGRVGNGDLGIARTMASLYYTLGLLSTLLTAPTERRARRAVGPVLRLLVRPSSARRHPERAVAASVALLQAQGGSSDPSDTIEAKGCLSVLLLPVLAAQLAFVVNQMLFSFLLVNPLLKRAWRARTELADATAVELTRHPDGLASGLVALARSGGAIPGTAALAHQFIVGGTGGGDHPLAGFQPKLDRRMAQLRALGSTVDYQEHRHRAGPVAKLLLVVIGGPLIAAFYLIMLGIAVAITGVAFMLYMLFLVGPVIVLDSVLRKG